MKSTHIFFTFTALLLFCLIGQGFSQQRLPRKYKKIQTYLDRATHTKLAGVVVYIQSPKHGEWTAASGYANVEHKQPIRPDVIFSLASIGKLYNAVAVLKLAEEGRLGLDTTIARYLPATIIDNLPNAKAVTLRHLLGHTSGFVNYEQDPELVKLYTSGLLRLDTLSHLKALRRYVFGRPANFAPGTRFDYSSTNYMLLAMIVDAVAPEGHTEYLRKLIRAQGFTNTYYRTTPPEKNVNYYGDLHQDGIADNLTAQTFETTNWFMGDDGVYAPIDEAAHFLQHLMKGKILNDQSLTAMKTWNDARKPDYGLGLMADKSFPYKFLLGHSGRGIGVTTDLYYFPKQDMTVAIFCNTGLRGATPEVKKTYVKMRSRIVKKLFLF
ncbi:serine hydrolase domain-containing protein [Chryseolinea lacunae]|uniref:Beta-lactamase family protein n=1 Tax=Chryseolinea lacunae TaxID=2801331 RepID=A0ABS1L1R8_9BACT|nr:serine hydrolase domain-containing protein [Chryseolinea lacunae]MBL0745631.1 beta-lactamase family protein [Chryseolinea lacunae]